MNVGVEYEPQIRTTDQGGFIVMAIRRLAVGITSAWNQEHKANDTHGTVTADSVTSRAWMQLTPTPYDGLPSVPETGMVACVSDATVNTWGTTVSTGGGSHTVLVYRNATAWTVYGV